MSDKKKLTGSQKAFASAAAATKGINRMQRKQIIAEALRKHPLKNVSIPKFVEMPSIVIEGWKKENSDLRDVAKTGRTELEDRYCSSCQGYTPHERKVELQLEENKPPKKERNCGLPTVRLSLHLH